MKIVKTLLAVLLIILVLLALPLIFKNRDKKLTYGPDLSELEYSEVSFENRYDNFQIAGMLFLPEGDGPFPTAIIVQGSGPSTRNSPWYLGVAEYLQMNGVAVLIPDKRGCEKSGGEWIGASIAELATDAMSSVEFIKTQEIFEPASIGLIGFSQGGWIVPVAAAKSHDVSFVVSLSGPMVTTDEQLLFEQTNSFAEYTYTFLAKWIAQINSKNLKQLEHLSALYPFDPIPYWNAIKVPVFTAFGEGDKNTDVDTSINRLHENHLDHYFIKSYPNGKHGILDPNTHELNKVFLNDLVLFIKG